MCGLQEDWEKEIKAVRPDVEIQWIGQHVANIVSNKLTLVGISREIRNNIYEPKNDVFPCIEYCRYEVIKNKRY
jgi:hypothetical protein